MKINETILKEIEEKVLDYFVITKEISKTMASIEKLNSEYVLDSSNLKVVGELKKDTYLYQFYNVFLVKVITNIALLYKIAKVHDAEFEKETEEKITNIIASDPDTMMVQGDEIVIIDEELKDIILNQLSSISNEEVNAIKKSKPKPKPKSKNEKGS